MPNGTVADGIVPDGTVPDGAGAADGAGVAEAKATHPPRPNRSGRPRC